MTKLGPYDVHPFADLFPLIEGDDFTSLVADVKLQGLREPIRISHDRAVLIDGRNRYRACIDAGVDPVFDIVPERYTEAMILDLIVSLNLERRHLNAGQKAMVALGYEKAYAAATRPGRPWPSSPAASTDAEVIPADLRELPQQPTPTPARERESATRAAKAVGASGRTVQQAKAVQRDAPDLAERVRAGTLALDAADRQRKQRLQSRPTLSPEPAKPSHVLLTLRTHTGDPVDYRQPKSAATFNDSKGEGISWASWSWNPVTGCLHGCDYCYAREIANNPAYASAFPVGFTPLFHSERLDAPANTRIPAVFNDDDHPNCDDGDCKICAYRRVFVCSMADLFGRWVPDEWIEQTLASCRANPRWQYLMLTKFPSRYVGLDLPRTAWIGTSVDEQKRVRIAEEAFRKIDDVAVKWLSLEPLKEPLIFDDLSMFDWVVIGAQTETHQPGKTVGAFAPPLEWVSSVIAQARDAGCKVHCKPNLMGKTGPDNPGMQMPNEYPMPRIPTRVTAGENR